MAFLPLSSLDTVIFDLGGVLYEIDVPRFQRAVLALAAKYGRTPTEGDRLQFIALSHQLETGHISPEAFLSLARDLLFPDAPKSEVESTWNTTLVGPYAHAQRVIDQLAHTHRLVLLSNTNRIHHNVFEPQMRAVFDRFGTLFFSFDLNQRKPDTAIYETVQQRLGLDPARTVFIDDTEPNLLVPTTLGWHTLHVPDGRELPRLLGIAS